MNEKNGFELVRRLSSAVEKAAPGAKRILSGMVTDTLALTKPVLTVFIGHRTAVGEALEMLLKFECGRKYNLKFVRFGNDLGFDSRYETELLKQAEEHPFDLIIAYCYLKPKEREIFAYLKARYRKPILITNMGLPDPSALAEAGIDAFLPSPFTVDEFRSALKTCAIIPN